MCSSGADVAARNLRAGTIDQVDPVTVLTVAENYQIFHRDILTAEKCRCPVCGPQQHRTIHRYSSVPGAGQRGYQGAWPWNC